MLHNAYHIRGMCILFVDVHCEFILERVRGYFLSELLCVEREYSADLGGVSLVVLVFCFHKSSVVVSVNVSSILDLLPVGCRCVVCIGFFCCSC